MENNAKLDFSLPQKKAKTSLNQKVILFLLCVITVLTGANLRMLRSDSASPGTALDVPTGLSAEQTKSLATKLAQRSLFQEAAGMWQAYLTQAQLAPEQQAKALFQIGLMLKKAGQLEQAITHFYRSEMAAKLDELAPQINTHIKDCFERLGRFSALRYELMDRTSYKGQDDVSGKVVARIGPEKITEADLTAILEDSIDGQLAPMASYMSSSQLAEQKKKMLEQFKDPQAKQQFIEGYLAQEILYRQALEERLTENPQIKKQLEALTRSVLAQQLMSDLIAAKINITEIDLQTYFEANKATYKDPQKARIHHILVAEEETAQTLIEKLKQDGDFTKLAQASSLDTGTKDKGGAIDVDVTPGAYVPVIGNTPELNAAIFQAQPGSVLETPFKTDKGWELVKVDSIQAERQKSFDEVRQEVMRTLSSQKQQEVQKEYIQQMMDKYNVVIHTSAFSPPAEEANAEKPQ
jgi:parvulin-like peptidyl-prolyl isomerase